MIIKTTPVASGPMTKGEAKALTDRIRQAVDGIGTLVEQAHDRGAWKAMGYTKWEDYVKTEFGFTRQRSYQLLDQGRVAKALAQATGDVTTTVDITEAAARDLKSDLPAAVAKITAKVEQGEDPKSAVKEVVGEAVSAKRAEKEKAKQERKAQQVEFDQHRDDTRSKLNPAIKAQEDAKARAKATRKPAALPAEDRVDELEEQVRVLVAENVDLKARVKKFSEMETEYAKGGFAEVVKGKDEVIATLKTRVERESTDKVSWKKSSDMWRKRAEGAGWSNDVTIDIETGAVVGA